MDKPNVFVDFHHGSLLKSFIILFERRLGGQVFRPIGTDWHTKGFWKVYDHPATVEQFLGIGGATPDGTARLNEVEGIIKAVRLNKPNIEWYNCHDIEGDEANKAITFETFMQLPIDIVIASIPAHVEPFKRLAALHPNKPKVIFQIGNAWTVEAAQAKNIMASAIINDVPTDINFISYHQEFDTKIFFPEHFELYPKKNIYSFINCFNTMGHFTDDWHFFQRLEMAMPDWNFKSFGGQCRDGSCDGSKNLASKMREARFIWHVKNGGDGFGHVLHNSAACGRPIITKMLYYAGKMGEKLMKDGETCINIDNLTEAKVIQKINYYSEPERYKKMCKAVFENFRKVCDFDVESILLQKFLDNLQ